MRTGTERVWTGLLLIGLVFAAGAEAQKVVSTSSAPTTNAPTAKPTSVTQITANSPLTANGSSGTPQTGPVILDVADGGVTNAKLANSSVTISAGSGLSGGGLVNLGGTATLGLVTPLTKAQLPGATAYTDAANAFTANQSIAGNLSVTGGNINLPATTSAAVGVLTVNGDPFLHRYSAGSFAYSNTYVGTGAGHFDTSNIGDFNTGVGTNTLNFNTTGTANTAIGFKALVENTSGAGNTALGHQALFNNTMGVSNIAIGEFAGMTTGASNGNYNIYIGDNITGLGLVGENSTIRIGDSNQTKTFVAGISGVTTGGTAAPVVVDTNGQLGTISSSRRFKYDIHGMDEATKNLLRLRPVTFRYKQAQDDGSHPLQYGLIAEEVADVYPELVQYDPKTGEPNTVLYHVLPAMLLNEFQKEHKQVVAQQEQIQSLQDQLAQLAAQTRQLQTEMTALKAQGEQDSKIAAITPRQ